MKYTPQQLHAAFYRAADVIERKPDSYSFRCRRVGRDGTPTCMWGHVARQLDMRPDLSSFTDVPKAINAKHSDLTTHHPKFDSLVGSDMLFNTAKGAPSCLRDFADHHWPQERAMPFGELMKSIQGVKA